MSETFKSPRHDAVRRLLREKRRSADLTQKEIADRIGRVPSFVSDVENGQHRVTVVEFFDFAEAIGFDALSALRRIAKTKPR